MDAYGVGVGYHELQDLYKICDLLLITSSQEGFGIPLLEAAITKLPIACSDIPSLSDIAGEEVLFFKLDDQPCDIAKRIIKFLDACPTYLMFRRIVSKSSWQSVYQDYLKELVGQF